MARSGWWSGGSVSESWKVHPSGALATRQRPHGVGELLARAKGQMPPRGWQPRCHAGQRSLWARTRSGAGWEPEAGGERIRVRAWIGGLGRETWSLL